MQITNFEYGSPYLATHHYLFFFYAKENWLGPPSVRGPGPMLPVRITWPWVEYNLDMTVDRFHEMTLLLCTNKSKFKLLSMTKTGQRLHLNWSGRPVRVNLFRWSLFRAFHCSSCIQWSVHFLCFCRQGQSDRVWARHLHRLARCLHIELFDIGLSWGIA